MEQEFKISQQRKTQYLIFSLLMFILFLFTLYYGVQVWQNPLSPFLRKYILYPFLIFYTFINTVFYLYNGSFMKITINQGYIKFTEFTFTITAKWAELITIENYNVGSSKFEGIRIIKRNIKRNIFGLLSLRLNYIPIHNFGKNWRDSELGQQIKQYAPHLFELEAQNHADQT